MKVRLVKNAPWPQVTMPDGFVITKTSFVEKEDHNLVAIQQWVEDEEHAEPDPITTPLSFSSMSKIDLILYCREKGIDVEGFNKEKILAKLSSLGETDEIL